MRPKIFVRLRLHPRTPSKRLDFRRIDSLRNPFEEFKILRPLLTSFDGLQDLGNSRQMPGPKIPKSGHFCPHEFSKILSAPRIRPRFCTKFVRTLDQALIGSVQNFPLCG